MCIVTSLTSTSSPKAHQPDLSTHSLVDTTIITNPQISFQSTDTQEHQFRRTQ